MSEALSHLTLRCPDDWHLHLRDDTMLQTVLPWTARYCHRAVVMPNLTPPVTSVAAARAYRQRILAALPDDLSFQPLMTCYLTDTLSAREVRSGIEEGVFHAVKLYPAHATTNSAAGVTDIFACHAVLETLQKSGTPLLIHGEVTDPEVDIFDREARFIERVLIPLRQRFPELKIVLEHITTREAAQYVLDGDRWLAATLTPQHLLLDRNAMLVGGIRPHYYCLPILKRREHQQALRRAVASGCDRFFMGTDSAPHTRERKEAACGCAGIFNAPVALSVYATVFEEEGALPLLENFCSVNGARFYGLPLNEGKIILEKRPFTVPDSIVQDDITLIPFLAGQTLNWTVEER